MSESENKGTYTSLGSWFRVAKIAFMRNLPPSLQHITSFPQRILYALGTIVYLFVIATYIGFFVWGYQQSLKEKFISLDSSSGNCSAVPKPITGTYLADANGEWEGSERYQYGKSKYVFKFIGGEFNQKQFSGVIKDIKKYILGPIGKGSWGYPVDVNVLIWLHFEAGQMYNGKVQTFSFKGDVGAVFDRERKYATLMAPDINKTIGTCAIEPLLTFNKESTILTISYDFNVFSQDQTSSCSSIDPEWFGHFDKAAAFSFDVDVTSLTIAMAVNNEVIGHDSLEYAALDPIPLYFDGTNIIDAPGLNYSELYLFAPKFNPSYPGMQPIWCLEAQTENHRFLPEICLLRVNGMFSVPFFQHFSPDCWGCPAGENYQPLGRNYSDLSFFLCENFAFNVGFYLFPPRDRTIDSADYILFDPAIQVLLHLAKGVDAANLKQNIFNSLVDRSAVDLSFCDGACVIVNTILFDSSNRAINEFYYTLPSLHCKDTFTSSKWENLENFFEPLTERYFECLPFKYNAAYDSFGVASGVAATILPLILLILMGVFRITFRKAHEEYKINRSFEKLQNKAIERLGHFLLMLPTEKSDADTNEMLKEFMKSLAELKRDHKEVMDNFSKRNNMHPNDYAAIPIVTEENEVPLGSEEQKMISVEFEQTLELKSLEPKEQAVQNTSKVDNPDQWNCTTLFLKPFP